MNLPLFGHSRLDLESMGRHRFTGGEGPGAVPASIGTPWMLDQVQHDIVFVGHSGLDPESIGPRRVAGGAEQSLPA
ncbi:hypothetical protein [Inquilinus sp. CAU 1745]|uniref:hypothetical protein n=1 Tax=Inquilinus sp. CAU 1745 TaxID=3140369 RepID=UPI00325B20CA